MKVSELMSKHPLNPDFAGVTTNDDWVLAVKTSPDQASEKDYIVIQSGVTSHAAQHQQRKRRQPVCAHGQKHHPHQRTASVFRHGRPHDCRPGAGVSAFA